MSSNAWFNRMQAHFEPQGFQVFDFAGNNFAIAKDIDGKMVIINEDGASVHPTATTAELVALNEQAEEMPLLEEMDPVYGDYDDLVEEYRQVYWNH